MNKVANKQGKGARGGVLANKAKSIHESALLTTGFSSVVLYSNKDDEKTKETGMSGGGIRRDILYTTEFDSRLSNRDALTVERLAQGTNAPTVAGGVPEIRNFLDLIQHYRTISNYPDVARALEHIIISAFPVNDTPFHLNFSEKDSEKVISGKNIPENTRKVLNEKFNKVLALLEDTFGFTKLFREWYVDSRQVIYSVVGTEEGKKDGILKLQKLPSYSVFKVIQYQKYIDGANIERISLDKEYFVYSPSAPKPVYDKTYVHNMDRSHTQSIVLDPLLIAYANSGLQDGLIGYLHQSLKPANILSMMEDAAVIYRMARAPERKVFYVDVGAMSSKQGLAYVKKISSENKVTVALDSTLGTISPDNNKTLSVLEDIWLPRFEGQRGTEVSTLPGGQQLGEVTDIEFFQKKLRLSLRVPLARFENPEGMPLGLGARTYDRDTDEAVFHQFITGIKNDWMQDILIPIFVTELIFSGVINDRAEYDELVALGMQVYSGESTTLAEQIRLNAIEQKVALLSDVDEWVGKYWDKRYVFREVMGMTEVEIDEMEKAIAKETTPPSKDEPT